MSLTSFSIMVLLCTLLWASHVENTQYKAQLAACAAPKEHRNAH